MLDESYGPGMAAWLEENARELAGGGFVGAQWAAPYAPHGGPAYSADDWWQLMWESTDPADETYVIATRAWQLMWPVEARSELLDASRHVWHYLEAAIAQVSSFGNTLRNQPDNETLNDELVRQMARMQPSIHEASIFRGWLQACERRRRRAGLP